MMFLAIAAVRFINICMGHNDNAALEKADRIEPFIIRILLSGEKDE